MATEKRQYEVHEGTNGVQFWSSAQDKEIRLEPGQVYSTSDPTEINDLEAHPKVKAAVDRTQKKDGS